MEDPNKLAPFGVSRSVPYLEEHGASTDAIRLRLFPFSLRNKARA